MLTPSEASLTKLGYKRYESNQFKPFCDFFYQRKITDDKGTRYFVEFWHYPESDGGHPEAWMFEMNINEPNSAMQIHRPATIEFCEVRACAFWRMMGSIYYETND